METVAGEGDGWRLQQGKLMGGDWDMGGSWRLWQGRLMGGDCSRRGWEGGDWGHGRLIGWMTWAWHMNYC